MKIAGLVRSSLIDYPGKIAAIVFTQGCNFRCAFCHNPDLIPLENKQLNIPEQEVIDFLKTRVGKLDGVVITGGEPLIQKDIEGFIGKIKKLGFSVKIDTNGSNPLILETLIKKKMVDYIAMDIKGTYGKYEDICAYPNKNVIQRSIDIIKNCGLPYEFRTTVLPMFHEQQDFHEVGEMIRGAKLYTIQGFRPQITLDPELATAKSFTELQLQEIAATISPYVEKVVIHPNL